MAFTLTTWAGFHSSMSDCRSGDCEFESQPDHKTFVELDGEIFSAAIHHLLLLEESLSVTGESLYI